MQKQKMIISIYLASLITIITLAISFVLGLDDFMSENLSNTNIPMYVLILVIYMVAYLVVWRIPIKEDSPKSGWQTGLILFMITIASVVCFNFAPLQLDSESRVGFLFGMELPLRLCIIVTTILLSSFIIIFFRMLEKDTSVTKVFFWCVVSGIAFFCCSYYLPNLVDYYSVHHFHAYANSIYNVVNGVPFQTGVYSIYGHYAFLYLPFVKTFMLVGFTNEVKIISLLATALVMISVFLYAYALDVLVESDFLKIISILLGFSVIFKTDFVVYLQNYPHRLLPCALAVFMVALWKRMEKKRNLVMIAGYLVCMLQVIWNNEMGIVCTIAWVAFSMIQKLQSKQYIKMMGCFFLIPICIGAAILLTGIMNCLLGGELISIRDFLFPLGIDQFMNEILQYDLSFYPAGWMVRVFVFCALISISLRNTCLLSKKYCENVDEAAYFGIAVVGLGTLVYAMNRPAFGNFYFSVPVVAISLSILIEQLLSKNYNADKILCGFSAIFASMMLCLACYYFCDLPQTISNRKSMHGNNLQAEVVSHVVQEKYNENLVGIGNSVAEIFAMSGLNSHFGVMDFSDFTISQECIDKFGEEILKVDSKDVFISEVAVSLYSVYLPEEYNHFCENHTLSATYSDGVQNIYYYLSNN